VRTASLLFPDPGMNIYQSGDCAIRVVLVVVTPLIQNIRKCFALLV
jgi:hypothetical protein